MTRTIDTSGKVIRRTYHGGTEYITLEEFAISAIQDDQMACQVALRMIEGEDPYQWNPDEPEFYEEFTVIDREGLLQDLMRVSEGGTSDPRPDPRTNPEYWTE